MSGRRPGRKARTQRASRASPACPESPGYPECFAHDPLGFVLRAFPWQAAGSELAAEAGPRDWQRERLEEIGRHLTAGGARDRALRMAVASGHGIGKSALVAWIVLWSLATLPMTRVVLTANTESQLRTKTWPEVSKWFHLMEGNEQLRLEALGIRARGPRGKSWRCDAVTWSATNTAAFAGLHNKGRRIVLIFDEASGIVDRVWEVADGALTDEDTEMLWLVFGNPTAHAGRFRECFAGGRFAHRWTARQIDSRTVPGTNHAEFARWVADWGEDSDFVRVRVRGQFPRVGSLQFIDGEVVEAAARRPAESHAGEPLIMGVDVARFGDDRSTFHFRRGRDARTIAPMRFRGLDLVTLAGKLAEVALGHRVDAVFIDEGGMGAGVVDMAVRLLRGTLVLGINFGGAPERCLLGEGQPATANKRAEMWAALRDWLKGGAIPDDAELKADLTGVQYGFNMRGEIQLEAKDAMKRRGLASPDDGDGLALTFAQPVGTLPWGAAASAFDSDLEPEMMPDDWVPYR